MTLGFGKANTCGCWLLEMCCPSATGWSQVLQQLGVCQAPEPELSAPCTHTRAHGVNSSTSSSYEPVSAWLSCVGWQSRGEAPRLPPEPCGADARWIWLLLYS